MSKITYSTYERTYIVETIMLKWVSFTKLPITHHQYVSAGGAVIC